MSTEDRPTDPSSLKPEAGAERASVVVPRAPAVPGVALQPDPSSYQDFVLTQLLERSRGLDAEQASLTNIAGLLEKQKGDIYDRLDETDRRNELNLSLVDHQVRGLVRSFDLLAVRVGNVEVSNESSVDKLGRLELDFAAMKTSMEHMQADADKLGRLELDLAAITTSMEHMQAEIDAVKRSIGAVNQ